MPAVVVHKHFHWLFGGMCIVRRAESPLNMGGGCCDIEERFLRKWPRAASGKTANCSLSRRRKQIWRHFANFKHSFISFSRLPPAATDRRLVQRRQPKQNGHGKEAVHPAEDGNLWKEELVGRKQRIKIFHSIREARGPRLLFGPQALDGWVAGPVQNSLEGDERAASGC